MSDVEARGPVKRVQIEATVIRGEDGRRTDLGVIADSARHWNYGPGRLLAWWRTKQANKQVKED